MSDNYAVVIKHFYDLGNESASDIARITGISYPTVKYNLDKIKETGLTAHRPRSGRPRKITPILETDIDILLDKPEANSTIKMKSVLDSLHKEKVSESTIRRHLRNRGIKFKLPITTPNLLPRHIEKRVDWGNQHRSFDWSKVIFSDESSIQLHRNTIKSWVRPGVTKFKKAPKFTKKIMVWGAISMFGRSELKIIRGNMDKEMYRGILQGYLEPFVAQRAPKKWIFQQDNNPKHCSKLLKQYFEEKKITVLDWPSCSPDLNPIENIWSILKRRVEERNPTTVDELEQIAKEEWVQIPDQFIQNSILSMEKRINELLDAKGNKINY